MTLSTLDHAAPTGTPGVSKRVSIRKDTELGITGIAIMDANAARENGVGEQRSRMDALSTKPGFRSAVLLKSRDGENLILYTQWQALADMQEAIRSDDSNSVLRPFGVVYLAIAGGGDTLNLSEGDSQAILVNIISTDPERIDKLYSFWVRSAESYWLALPHVVGTALHRSADNNSFINIGVWKSAEDWLSARDHAGENRASSSGNGMSRPELYDILALTTR